MAVFNKYSTVTKIAVLLCNPGVMIITITTRC